MCCPCSAGGCLQALHAAKGLVARYPGTHGHLASLIGAWVRLEDLTGAPHATAFHGFPSIPSCLSVRIAVPGILARSAWHLLA